MTAGRKPKATKVKKLEGNPGKRPLNENEPTPRELTGVPPCPMHLTGWARKEWHRVAEELTLCHILSKLELSLLEMYCEAIGRFHDAQAALKKIDISKLAEGDVSQKQTVRILLGMIREANVTAKAIGSELGITPSSRTRLGDGGSGGGTGSGGNAGTSDNNAKSGSEDSLFDF